MTPTEADLAKARELLSGVISPFYEDEARVEIETRIATAIAAAKARE